MSKRCILVSFPRFPYTFNTLLPDSLLAGIAGSLVDAGHQPLILDYGTLETVQRYFSSQLRRASLSLADQMVGATQGGALKALGAFLRLRGLGGLQRHRREMLRRELLGEAAREVAGDGGVDLVVVSVRDAGDVGNAVDLGERIRSLQPDVVLAAAGPFIERYGELIARRTKVFDCLCLGEPEWTIPRFADVLDRPELWTETPNLAVMRGGGVRLTRRKRIDLNSVAFPDYSAEVYPALDGDGKFKLLGVCCTRVCSQQCPACPHGERQPGLSRPRTPRSVCEALSEAMRQQNVCAFALEGPAFSEAYAVSLAREMLSRGLAVLYTREASIRETRVANLATYKASGCQALSYRVDTGSQWLLEDYYRRGFSVSQCEKVLKSSGASGIFSVGRFIYPSPADDSHTRAETLRLIERVRPGSALFELPEPSPGSEWLERCEDFGFRLDLPGYVRRAVDSRGAAELPLKPWRTLLHARRSVPLHRAQRELEHLCGEVRDAGVSTWVTPELGLVGRVSGYEDHEQDFATLMLRKFVTGDVAGIADAAARFNRQASLPAQRVAGGTYMPVLAAAGN
ncbi:MAG: hypothetical protein NTZ09_12160 [Candidatus Hydrogenedentes bacterium]|nr:hypothetical protein [Candidatus Hydrogenedentota bacterium]